MTREQYIILAMVVAGIATNFLGAAFTLMRLAEARRRNAKAGDGTSTQRQNNELFGYASKFEEDLAFYLSFLKTIAKLIVRITHALEGVFHVKDRR
jgi:hypothetical protein